jgi:hypothetical protein
MTPWTHLLESLHSTLIDELIERYPDFKPELGMPRRANEWALPTHLPVQEMILINVQFDHHLELGFSGLAAKWDSDFEPDFDLKSLWQKLRLRAQKEFQRRALAPLWGPEVSLTAYHQLPEPLSAPKRLIWIPVKVPTLQLWLAIGTY